MTFRELDARIRAAVTDDVERKKILEGLHGIEEAMNQCAAFWLSVSGYTIDVESGDIHHPGRSTRFQIND
tara:strand:+ start:173 stop:382 length:210 start_codon:yes stop_codon:yes gene_type:complete